MQQKILLLFTLFTLSSLLMLQSCTVDPDDEKQDCRNSPAEYYKLTTGQKAIIPYKGYDTISMVSNTGDTIRCIGTGKQYFNTREFVPHSHPSCAGYGTEKFYEAYKIEFVDSFKDEKITLTHYENSPYTTHGSLSVVDILFQENHCVTRDLLISKSTAYNFIGDVEIRGAQYNNVTKAESEPVSSSIFTFISKSNGIIKIQLNEDKNWELIKK